MRTLSQPSQEFKRCVPFCHPPHTAEAIVLPAQKEHTIVVVHRFEGRTIPCLEPTCFLCESRIKIEERIYFLALLLPDSKLVIVDLPTSHHEAIVGATTRYRGLQRLALGMSRKYPAPNAPIMLRFAPAANGDTQLARLSLIEELGRNWGTNVEYAADRIAAEKTSSRIRTGCEIGGRHDSK